MGAYDFGEPDDVLRFVGGVDYPYAISGIYPSEMAYFLHLCARAGVQCIIESGREQGYSTAVLGAYGEQSGTRIVSIDAEEEPDVASACRRRLARYPRLELIAGNSFRVLPGVLQAERGRIALLVDGPKRHYAIYLSATACAVGTVCLVAHHNVRDDDDVLPHFRKRFPDAGRLEQSEIYRAPAFATFRAWEKRLTEGTLRDLERSTLVVSVLREPGPNAGYLAGLTPAQTLSAHCVFGWWKLGAPRLGMLRLARWSIALVRRCLRVGWRVARGGPLRSPRPG